MPAGEMFSSRQRADIQRAVEVAEGESGLAFAVHVARLDDTDPRADAVRAHAAAGQSASLVLVAVDPVGRHLEIVTGSTARRFLDDRSCWLAGLTMTSSFRAGDLVGGLLAGIRSLADHARHPRTLHLHRD